MDKLTVVAINQESIIFNNGVVLDSDHNQDCCEEHYLSFEDLDLKDFNGLEFDLTGDTFFKKIDGYGVELVPINGFSVKVPGYGSNNGYYSDDLTLCVRGEGIDKEFDITECQEIDY